MQGNKHSIETQANRIAATHKSLKSVFNQVFIR